MGQITDFRASDRCIYILELVSARRETLERTQIECGVAPRSVASADQVQAAADGCTLVVMEDQRDELTDQHVGALVAKGYGVILFSKNPHLPRVVELLTVGAAGYLQWPFGRAEFCQALDTTEGVGRERLRIGALRARATALIERLTRRESQILGLVSAGYRSEDISLELGIAKRTVDAHRFNILTKLEVSLPMAQRLGVYAGLDRRSADAQGAKPGQARRKLPGA